LRVYMLTSCAVWRACYTNLMITVDPTFLDEFYGAVSAMFADLADIETGIFTILIFAFAVRMILDWLKRIKYV